MLVPFDFSKLSDVVKNDDVKKTVYDQLVAPLIDECTETVEEVKLAKTILAEKENSYKCNSCKVFVVLFSTILTINVGNVAYYVYSRCYTKNK